MSSVLKRPSACDLRDAILQALRTLGGSSERQEIYAEVLKTLADADKDRVGFAQTDLKRKGLLENPSRGRWRLTELGWRASQVDWPEQRTGDGTAFPTLDKLINPTLSVFHQLGGSGTIEEIEKGIIDFFPLSKTHQQAPHDPERGKQTELAYRLAVCRRYLKRYGLLENLKPKHWALTEKGASLTRVNPFAVILHAERTMWRERTEREAAILSDLTDVDATMDW